MYEPFSFVFLLESFISSFTGNLTIEAAIPNLRDGLVQFQWNSGA